MNDELGERMKEQYEHRTRYFVPRRTYTIIRLDGKAFHTYTKGLDKPFDMGLIEDMDSAIVAMMPKIQGVILAYTQSDEISLLLTDFGTPQTSAWFDGNIQKMASVSSSVITGEFNRFRARRWRKGLKEEMFMAYNGMGQEADDHSSYATDDGCIFNIAYFDSRVFTIPDRTEVLNYLIWRNQDCARNAVSMVAQSKFSHKELQGKSTSEMQEMLFQNHGINWSEYDASLKNGRLIYKETGIPELLPDGEVLRSRWKVVPGWKFTENRDWLESLIPKYV